MSEEVRRSLWVVAKCRSCEIGVLTLHLDTGEEVLPVFSSREAAVAFLHYLPWWHFSGGQKIGSEWFARESSTGELISLLCGPCKSVDQLVLDLRPETAPEGLSVDLFIGRKEFIVST